MAFRTGAAQVRQYDNDTQSFGTAFFVCENAKQNVRQI